MFDNRGIIKMGRSQFLFVIFCLLSSCMYAQKKKSKGEDSVQEFKEDLSAYRPSYKRVEDVKKDVQVSEIIIPKNDINKFLKEKLDSVYFYNANICCADGFRILVYIGTSSEEAKLKRNDAYDVLPLEKSYTEWKQPSFKVKVGDYVDKLEAYYAYAKLVAVFPNAIVIPDKVNIVRDRK